MLKNALPHNVKESLGSLLLSLSASEFLTLTLVLQAKIRLIIKIHALFSEKLTKMLENSKVLKKVRKHFLDPSLYPDLYQKFFEYILGRVSLSPFSCFCVIKPTKFCRFVNVKHFFLEKQLK